MKITYNKKIAMLLALYIVYEIFFVLLVPIFVGFAGGGFEVGEILDKFQFYVGVGIGFSVATVALAIFSMLYFKESDKEINGIYLWPVMEKSFLPKFLRSPLNLLFISLIFFGALAFFATTTQTGFFSGIPKLEQQFTAGADITFAMFPAASAENAGLVFFISLALVGLGVLFKKNKIDGRIFFYASIVISLIMAILYGVALHQLRYGFDEFSIGKVALFWGFEGLLYPFFGFLVIDVLHSLNNLFVKLGELFSNDLIRNVSIGVIIAVIIIYTFILLVKSGKKKAEGKSKGQEVKTDEIQI